MRSSRGRPIPAVPGARRIVGDAPLEKIVTEAELRVKKLLEAQMDNSVTVPRLQAQYKQFSSAVRYEPLLSSLSGATSLSSYKEVLSHHEKIEDLRQYGLTEDDVQFKLRCEEKPESIGRLMNPEVVQQKTERIEQLIEAKQRHLQQVPGFSGAAAVTRHTMELERAIGHGEKLIKMADCLLYENSSDRATLSGCVPANRCSSSLLREITEDITASINRVKRTGQIESSTNGCKMPRCSADCARVELPSSRPLFEPTLSSSINCLPEGIEDHKLVSTCQFVGGSSGKKEEPREVTGNSLVPVSGPVRRITDDEIVKNRMCVEELKLLAHFSNYEAGKPSNVLYVKNIAAGMGELDLVALFQRFDVPTKDCPIIYRLLVGRMKGQAFVTFPDEETATAALQLVNGFVLRGKPLVISYGRGKVADTS